MTSSPRTSRADRNVLSWSGDTLQWFLGTDHPEPCDRTPETVYPNDPTQWDSALKVSGNAAPIYVSGIAAAQCRENVLDVNHSHGVTFLRTKLGREGEVGEQVITIKGGSSDITVAGEIYSRGTNADCTIGQWSDQSTEPSHSIDLVGLKRADGKPLTVILARADRDTIHLPAGAKVLFWKSLGYTLYWYAKRAAVALGLFGRA